MEVKLRVYASLREYLPELSLGQTKVITAPDGIAIGEMLDLLGIPRGEVRNCFVNGLQREQGFRLSDGDDVAIFPPVGGGSGV
ncbi:MAG: MoaD/ThiS family protein [Chloroflexota bacterium]|jgi:molybdopterin synthase sulfur carrier subunit